MAEDGGLVVYVTSHGFGHMNRSVAVINRIPPDVSVTIRCHPSLFPNWGERLTRAATLEAHVSDAGAANPPGDSAATDGRATLELAEHIHREALSRVDEEAQLLRERNVAAVLTDAPPLPLVAAARAGVPGYLLANFTWAQIYAPHARRLGGRWPRFVNALNHSYRHATRVFRAQPALAMPRTPAVTDVGLVVTPGRNRRAEVRRHLGIGQREKLVYFYIGRYGQESLAWERLERMEGIHFVGFHAAPTGSLKNLHVVRPSEWTGADLAASADASFAKAGYGTACEAMVARTPFIYPPRTGFSEHRALDRSLRAWGGGIPCLSRAFHSLRIEPLLERAFSAQPGPAPFPVDGARRVAEQLTAICRTTKRRGALRTSGKTSTTDAGPRL